MADRAKVEIDGHVAVVTLDRGGKHNALDMAMFEAIIGAGESIAANRGVRAVVLNGTGPNFCAGIDTSLFRQAESAITADKFVAGDQSPANFFQRAAYIWREVPVPVVCAITGVAFGGGLQLALGADLRYARPDAQLSIMEIKWGIVPDLAITQTLMRCIRVDILKELAWSGRVVSGEEAARLGLVTAVHDDPLQAALESARGIAARSPDAIRAMKRLFDTAPELSVADALQFEASLQQSLLGGANHREAVQANIERRDPVFHDPEH